MSAHKIMQVNKFMIHQQGWTLECANSSMELGLSKVWA